MDLKVITNKAQYSASMEELERLMESMPSPGTPEADRVLVISKLIETYEKEKFHFELPEPIDAIKFRMEEQGLKQTDLVPYIGSKSKVSEILAGKRSLTIPMIRALSHGLGIPAEVLLQEPSKNVITEEEVDWKKFPIKEMTKLGWIQSLAKSSQDQIQAALEAFLKPIKYNLASTTLWRRGVHSRSGNKDNYYSLIAWAARVLNVANTTNSKHEYISGCVDKNFMKELANLSWLDKGPLIAREFLEKHGILLIIEPHLEGTQLDGCAMLSKGGRPVIGLTLRHDRIDNFWFTLMHEVAHIFKHLNVENDIFLDDLDRAEELDTMEKEADYLSQEAFIPRHIWTRSEAFRFKTEDAVIKLARELRIHPSIIAGRIRRETKDFKLLPKLIGQNQVRVLFGVQK